jgi:hypothetical protein
MRSVRSFGSSGMRDGLDTMAQQAIRTSMTELFRASLSKGMWHQGKVKDTPHNFWIRVWQTPVFFNMMVRMAIIAGDKTDNAPGWQNFSPTCLEYGVDTNSFGGRLEVGLVPLLLKLHTSPVAPTSRQLYKMLRSLVRRSIMLHPDLRPVVLCKCSPLWYSRSRPARYPAFATST